MDYKYKHTFFSFFSFFFYQQTTNNNKQQRTTTQINSNKRMTFNTKIQKETISQPNSPPSIDTQMTEIMKLEINLTKKINTIKEKDLLIESLQMELSESKSEVLKIYKNELEILANFNLISLEYKNIKE